MPRIEIAVEGMTSGHCETSVTAALQATGATQVEADFRRGRASADFDGDPAVLADAIREAGHVQGDIETRATEEASLLAASGPYDLAIVGSGGVPLSPPPSRPPTWAPES